MEFAHYTARERVDVESMLRTRLQNE